MVGTPGGQRGPESGVLGPPIILRMERDVELEQDLVEVGRVLDLDLQVAHGVDHPVLVVLDLQRQREAPRALEVGALQGELELAEELAVAVAPWPLAPSWRPGRGRLATASSRVASLRRRSSSPRASTERLPRTAGSAATLAAGAGSGVFGAAIAGGLGGRWVARGPRRRVARPAWARGPSAPPSPRWSGPRRTPRPFGGAARARQALAQRQERQLGDALEGLEDALARAPPRPRTRPSSSG